MSAPEFDGQPMTKREVLIARDAFVAACRICTAELPQWEWQAKQTAESRYPLPKVTRPRVWLEPACEGGMAWRVISGELEYTLSTRPDLLDWKRVDPLTCEHEVTPKRIRAWAGLLANPTEEVEDES